MTLTFNTHIPSYIFNEMSAPTNFQVTGHNSSEKFTVFTFSYRKVKVTKFDLAVK